jgi:hypothetical protein
MVGELTASEIVGKAVEDFRQHGGVPFGHQPIAQNRFANSLSTGLYELASPLVCPKGSRGGHCSRSASCPRLCCGSAAAFPKPKRSSEV